MTTEKIITTPKHTKHTFSYAASIAWQRLSYYGWRSILFLLLFDEFNNSNSSQYGYLVLWISIGLSISYLLGGILGDLLIGNKKTTLIGGFLMFIGSILFFFEPTIDPPVPIAIFVIGCGLYQSNLKALFAKLYLHDTRLLDSAFIMFNLFINMGSFLGVFLVGLVAETYGIKYGFLMVGISTLLSISMLLVTKKIEDNPNESDLQHKSLFNKNQLKPIGLILMLFAIYCVAWRLSYYDMYSIYWTIDFEPSYLTGQNWIDGLSFFFYIIIGIFLVVLWSKKYYDDLTKLTVTSIVTLLSFGLSFIFYSEASITTSVLTIITLFTYTFAELLVEPLINSSVAKIVNRRYLAIGYGAVGLIYMGVDYLFLYMEKGVRLMVKDTIYIGLTGLLIFGAVLLIRKLSKK